MAATTESFNAVLKRYTPYKMLFNEVKKHNWLIERCKKRQDWYGGTMEVPFEAGEASSLQWGALTAEGDIAEGEYLMGTLTNSDLKELWGTQVFHQKDLRRHKSMAASYLAILPERTRQFVRFMSERVSVSFLGDGSMATATANGTTTGIAVDFPHRFRIGEKIAVDDGDSAPTNGYITKIDINSGFLTVEDARSGGSAVDLSAYTTAQAAKVYIQAAQADGPATLASILLTSGNGGDANYFGYTKADYPILQALNIDGSGFTATTLLDDLYTAYYHVLDRGAGNLDKTLVMPLTWMARISSQLDSNRRYEMKTLKSMYGFREVEIVGPDGVMKIIAIRDINPKSRAFILDLDTIELCGNSFFKRDVDANGNEFHIVRAASGKKNIVDYCFEAAMVVRPPAANAIIHSVPSSVYDLGITP